MKKNLLFFSFLFLWSITTYTQGAFLKTFEGSDFDYANQILKTNDGNMLVLGSTTNSAADDQDGYFLKMNNSGKKIWDRKIGTEKDEVITDGLQLDNGDIIVLGNTNEFALNNSDNNLFVTRIDEMANVVWSKKYDNLISKTVGRIVETNSGDFLIIGIFSDQQSNKFGTFFLKLSQNGDIIWYKTVDGFIILPYYFSGIIENSVGDHIISGYWRNEEADAFNEAGLLTLDSNSGTIKQVHSYSDSNLDYTDFVGDIKVSGNGFVCFGHAYNDLSLDRSMTMTQIDGAGNVSWSKRFWIEDSWLRPGKTIRLLNGNFLLTAFRTESNPAFINDGVVIEITEDGEILWAKTYGNENYDDIKSIIEVDNGFLLAGFLEKFSGDPVDILIARTNEFGSVSGCSNDIAIQSADISLVKTDRLLDIEDGTIQISDFVNLENVDLVEEEICDGCNSEDLVAGLICDDAPIICSIDCLDGFTATLPDELIGIQPDPLCNGGAANNVSWFAFVAGSNFIDLSIVPTNCTTIFDETGTIPQTIGIQAGVYEGCDFENSFICRADSCMDLTAETINISSDQFEIGQVYYLFVDGCGGSVCDYEVIVNSADQAFEMPEITTISNNFDLDLDVDTLCVGSEITFTLDDFELDVEFNWTIDPPIDNYPSGVHPVIDTNVVTFILDEEGCFDISVYAYNECDDSETQTFSVCVETLEDEMFSDIFVCQECFPITLIAPESGCIITEGGGAPTVLIEDPNGDGVPGWLGTTMITGPGLDSNVVENVFGCTYKQYVNVVEIPISPREQVDYYFCLTEFPVDINGMTFTNPGDTRNITLEGSAVSGCDSLMSITAYGIDLFGSSTIGNCESGQVELGFQISSVMPMDYDSITYTWYDDMGGIVTDTDDIDSILVVTGVGSYSVQVSVYVGSDPCAQTFGPFSIDVDNLSPSNPSITYAPNSICASNLLAPIYVGNQGLGEMYTWTLNPNLPFTFGLTSDTIYVDITSGESFEFCVEAMNGCGNSEIVCDDVIVNVSPDSEFTYTNEVCIDDFAIIEYAGSFGTSSTSIFTWDFDGGSIANGANPNSAGPFEIEFSTAGSYTISLILQESGCNSIVTEHMIDVIEPFNPPTIECESESGFITFSWDDTNVESVDIEIVSGQSNSTLLGNTFSVNGLGSEEEVEITITFNSGDVCGGSIVTENCTSLPCPSVDLTVELSNQDICLSDGSDVTLDIMINGDASGSGSWQSPFIVDGNTFDIESAGIGTFDVSYVYTISDCTYTLDTMLSIYDTPEVSVDIFPSLCQEMGSSTIDVLTDAENGVLLDGNLITDMANVELDEGAHSIIVTNLDGCSTELGFNVELESIDNIILLGDTSIILSESGTFSIDFDTTIDSIELVWTLDGEIICTDCSEVIISPENSAELCVVLNFGDGCQIVECRQIKVVQETEVYIPNVFSPNGDNINDLFTIFSNSEDAFISQVMIFDRWGELMFEKAGFNIQEVDLSWDGRFNGKLCPPGVYVYVIQYLNEENQTETITGDITLVR
ncbi:MAG: gliding motility-associated C-terminal domain-containing protein [Saprospiraceae bacterium]|nr:gliding motility-associated C-terminal domain-containing protein [Saprospiraceae bacterium]